MTTTYVKGTRVTQISLPADLSASAILRRFIREISRSTSLSESEINELQITVTKTLENILQQNCGGSGRIVVKINATDSEVHIDLAFHENSIAEIECLSRT